MVFKTVTYTRNLACCNYNNCNYIIIIRDFKLNVMVILIQYFTTKLILVVILIEYEVGIIIDQL